MSNIISKLNSWVNDIFITTSEKQKDKVLDTLQRICKEAGIASSTRITNTNGPNQHIIKVQNSINRRMVKIEIPKVYDPKGVVCMELLEKSHDLEENIDRFYLGTKKNVTYNELIESLKDEQITVNWLKAFVDRSNDKDRVNAIRMIRFEKPLLGTLNWDIIEDISLNAKIEGGGRYLMKLVNSNEVLEIDVEERDYGLFKPGRMFIINYAGKYTATTFNNAKKFLTFEKNEWAELCRINGFPKAH